MHKQAERVREKMKTGMEFQVFRVFRGFRFYWFVGLKQVPGIEDCQDSNQASGWTSLFFCCFYSGFLFTGPHQCLGRGLTEQYVPGPREQLRDAIGCMGAECQLSESLVSLIELIA